MDESVTVLEVADEDAVGAGACQTADSSKFGAYLADEFGESTRVLDIDEAHRLRAFVGDLLLVQRLRRGILVSYALIFS